MEYVRLLHELERGIVDFRPHDQQVAATLGALVNDVKGVFDAVSRSESVGMSMVHKRSTVKHCLRANLTPKVVRDCDHTQTLT